MASNPIVLKAWMNSPILFCQRWCQVNYIVSYYIDTYLNKYVWKKRNFLFLFIYLFLIYIFQNLKKCQLNIFDEL